MGVFAPGGTPRSVIDQIAACRTAIMADKEVQGKLIKAGFEPVNGIGPEETAKFVQEELARWTPLLKASGIKMQLRSPAHHSLRRSGRMAGTRRAA